MMTSVVVEPGSGSGSEYALESASQTLGRGPGVDIVLQGEVKLLYVAPETLKRPETLRMLADCQVK